LHELLYFCAAPLSPCKGSLISYNDDDDDDDYDDDAEEEEDLID